ncbi:MAG: hypothetical protein U0746_08410 [Gemmataceae bacterium]
MWRSMAPTAAAQLKVNAFNSMTEGASDPRWRQRRGPIEVRPSSVGLRRYRRDPRWRQARPTLVAVPVVAVLRRLEAILRWPSAAQFSSELLATALKRLDAIRAGDKRGPIRSNLAPANPPRTTSDPHWRCRGLIEVERTRTGRIAPEAIRAGDAAAQLASGFVSRRWLPRSHRDPALETARPN